LANSTKPTTVLGGSYLGDLFLIASLPLIVWWKKSGGSLIFSLGLAHWLVMGLFGLVQAL